MRSHRLSSDSMRRLSLELVELRLLRQRRESLGGGHSSRPQVITSGGYFSQDAGILVTGQQCLRHLVVKAHLVGLSQADCSVVKARMENINEEWFGERDSLELFEK